MNQPPAQDTPRPLPPLDTTTQICVERILLCGPCADIMSEDEWRVRHARFYEFAAKWTEAERTDFWYTLDRLCADGNPAIRATPGLVMTPENFGLELRRLAEVAETLMDPGSEIQGFPVWGFTLYASPVGYSFTFDERRRCAHARVFGASVDEFFNDGVS